MKTILFSELQKNLKIVIDNVADQCEPLIVRGSNGNNVILTTLSDYESLKETAYLLGSEANAKHLRKSLNSLRSRKN